MKLPIINGTYDQAARESFKVNPSSAFSWFLSASFAYYLRFESLLSDEVFDKLSKYLLDNYDKIDHINKALVTKDMLKAGSAYNLSESDYPLRVRISSDELIRNLLEHKNMTG